MIKPSPDDKVYPVIKLATVIDALAAEGISTQDALAECAYPGKQCLRPRRGFRLTR
jgi:hypothetical protein